MQLKTEITYEDLMEILGWYRGKESRIIEVRVNPGSYEEDNTGYAPEVVVFVNGEGHLWRYGATYNANPDVLGYGLCSTSVR